AKDQLSQFPSDAFSSHTDPMPRKPGPIQPESCPMPANDGFGLDENQSPVPMSPEPAQHHPEQFVRKSKPRLRMLLFQDGELLSKSQIFQEQFAARAKEVSTYDRQKPQQAQHETSLTCKKTKINAQSIYLIRRQIGILARDSACLRGPYIQRRSVQPQAGNESAPACNCQRHRIADCQWRRVSPETAYQALTCPIVRFLRGPLVQSEPFVNSTAS